MGATASPGLLGQLLLTHARALPQHEARGRVNTGRWCVSRYKQQLSLAVEREQSLEREQVQLGLDWQRRCDDVERDQIQRSETLIQGLTKAREQVRWVLGVEYK